MLDQLLQKMYFQCNERLKQNENKHLRYFFIDWVTHFTITAFFVQDRVNNQGVIGCTTKKVPSPSLKSLTLEPPFPPNPAYFYSADFEQLSCLSREVMVAVLD